MVCSRLNRLVLLVPTAALGLGILALFSGGRGIAQNPADGYAETVPPLLQKYCLGCHSAKDKKGSLDLERFSSLDSVRRDLKPWQQLVELVEAGEMPPRDKPQPTAAERKRLLDWTRNMLDAEARARAGDPGHVPLRRLSNAEYNCTIRELTGIDLRPAREFPADGAAGEGFTNAAEGLSDISTALLGKYLDAAREIAAHSVLLPDGFRFSPSKTRRDWTDESTGRLRAFYAAWAPADGKLPILPYLAAAVHHRDALLSSKISLRELAGQEKLNPRYFETLWRTLTDTTPSGPLDAIRSEWRKAKEADVPSLVSQVASWQARLWKTARIGSYLREEGKRYVDSPERQVAVDPPAVDTVPLRLAVKPAAGRDEVTLYLASHSLSPEGGRVVWQRPRFEAGGKPALLLKDYGQYGRAYEVDYSSVFAGTSKYLNAVIEAAERPEKTVGELAAQRGLEADVLERWISLLAIAPLTGDRISGAVPATPLTLLEEKSAGSEPRPAIGGWRKKGSDLPILLANSSDKTELLPGRITARGIAVHPLPQEFVAVVWKSPISAEVRIEAKVAHAHPACGNGVAWWLEHRRDTRHALLGSGTVDLGKEVKPPAKVLRVQKGDLLVLAVDARNGNHVCDMTEIGLTIAETDKSGRAWNLGSDVAGDVLSGNPHADKQGNADAWSFVYGPSTGTPIPEDSLLGRWRAAALDPGRRGELEALARMVQALLVRPATERDFEPDRKLNERMREIDGNLLRGLDLSRFAKSRSGKPAYGLPKALFGQKPDDANIEADADSAIEIRLPAALLAGREFLVEGRLAGAAGDRCVQFRVSTTPPDPDAFGIGPLASRPDGAAYQKLLRGYADFRHCFPPFLCFPQVVPNDEAVTLKMFHREDGPLCRLFLGTDERNQLDRLWTEHRFISRQAVAENGYLPQFIAFVTQENTRETVAFFEALRPAFQKRAEEFLEAEAAAIPGQLAALEEFAARAYRRPLKPGEKAELLALYKAILGKGAGHEEAFRAVLARVLSSPNFLFRIESAPAGKAPAPIDDWELATRLSYFLWSGPPDDELRKLAAAGQVRSPETLAAQTKRMLKDDRLRSLAIEFGTQWIHVRGFDELKEKNETLFPTFDAGLRKSIYEESILFFQDLFQADRPVADILGADATFLDERLAKHYGIPGVTGPPMRRVEGVQKYGRGGVLGLASVQAKQAGASRTSPVLRGNWVCETLLGEKLPRPPANVPQLPEAEGDGGLTVRQQVEKHVRDASCATCHARIDPFGFALEKYDPIGRLRAKDLGGLPADTRAKLKDGTEFDGIDGLRNYLLTKKRDVFVRLFCKRLLGYALGRSVALSDQSLIDEMMADLDKNGGRISAAVMAIVRSPQFRMVRGSGFGE